MYYFPFRLSEPKDSAGHTLAQVRQQLRNVRNREKTKNMGLQCLNNLLTKSQALCKERIKQIDKT